MTEPAFLSDEEFQAAAHRLAELVEAFDGLPYPEVREQVFELLRAVDGIHREGLGRLIAFIHEQGQAGLVLRAAHDPVVHTLLQLYDFIPSDDRTQVEAALDTVRPYIHSHGGEVEVLDVVDGIVHLRLAGSCHGCAGSAITLKRGVEAALREGYAGYQGIEVFEPAPATTPVPAGFIPLSDLGLPQPREVRRPVFKSVARLDQVPAGTMKHFEVDGAIVLVANVDGEVYAVRDTCPTGVAPLHLGSFTPPIVVCPWHNDAYDVRTGKRADSEGGPGLSVLPIAVADGIIQLAVNTAAEPQPVENS